MNIGNTEQSWSSTVDGRNAYYLSFDYANISPSNPYRRTYGYSVRCLRE